MLQEPVQQQVQVECHIVYKRCLRLLKQYWTILKVIWKMGKVAQQWRHADMQVPLNSLGPPRTSVLSDYHWMHYFCDIVCLGHEYDGDVSRGECRGPITNSGLQQPPISIDRKSVV